MRILLIGFNAGFARSLARYVSGDIRVTLTAVASDLTLADLMLPATRATLVLLDWSVLGRWPTTRLQALRLGRPGLRIVGVLQESEAYRAAALAAGADAVISMGAFAEELEPLLRGFSNERSGACGGRDE